MKITYDSEADAAYIQLVARILPGEASEQTPATATPHGKGEIILDFNAAGELLGIEILFAKDVLSGEVLAQAVPPGGL